MNAPRNSIAQSVHDRLRKIAADYREDFNALLARYGSERFLCRLARSPYGDQFVLKGAMLFILWLGRLHRPTRDLDLLAYGEITEASLRTMFAKVCRVPAGADGLEFDPASISVQEIRENQVYRGMRLKIRGCLGNARVDVQIDVGIGDAITPKPIEVDYPTLLDLPAPRLKAYPPETVVAEKLEAMIQLGLRNSRMKDFFDVWLLARNFAFAGEILVEAARRTLERRQTQPAREPACFSDAFASDLSKQVQGKAFIRRSGLTEAPSEFSQVMAEVRTLLQPLAAALAADRRFNELWPPGGPWQAPS